MSDDPLATPELTTTLDIAGGDPVLRVAGEIDLFTAPQFIEALDQGLEGGRGLRVDLRKVAFMDSTGLRALLETRRRLEGSGAMLTLTLDEAGPVTRLLELAGVSGLFARERGAQGPV